MANEETKVKAAFQWISDGVVKVIGASLKADEASEAIELKPITINLKMTPQEKDMEAARTVWIRIQGTYRRAVNSKKEPKTHSIETFEDLFGYDLEAKPAQAPTKKVDKAVKAASQAIQEIMEEMKMTEQEAKQELAKRLGLI